MRQALLSLSALLFLLSSPAHTHAQQTFYFNTDPFAGSTAPATPGRQVVTSQLLIEFDVQTDVFAFNRDVFGFGNEISFANDLIDDIPPSGADAIVLQTFTPPFGAGTAANLLAEQIQTPGAGVFVYFNTGLNFARLVYSADLDDATADLKVLAALTNISSPDQLASFSQANFALVPEPSALLLLITAGAVLVSMRAVRIT